MTTMDGEPHDVGRWDLLIAHPPCTYLTASSAVRLFNSDHTIKDCGREQKGWEARQFFLSMLSCGIERIAVENPAPLRWFKLPKYSQIIEPYMFGDPWKSGHASGCAACLIWSRPTWLNQRDYGLGAHRAVTDVPDGSRLDIRCRHIGMQRPAQRPSPALLKQWRSNGARRAHEKRLRKGAGGAAAAAA